LNSVALCAVGVPYVSGQAIFMVRIGSIRSLDGLIPYFAANRPGRLNAFPSVPSMGRFLLDERSGDEGQHARARLSQSCRKRKPETSAAGENAYSTRTARERVAGSPWGAISLAFSCAGFQQSFDLPLAGNSGGD